MAVPKKKISRSRTRARLKSKPINSILYTECKKCQNFMNPHSFCLDCFNKKSSLTNPIHNSRTNIKSIYNLDFS